MPGSSDRNLLFGILALQMDFITREQLVAGMQAWVLAKEIALAEHLVQAGAMKLANRQLLEPLVEAHIRQHGDDPQQSLASISSLDALRNELAGLGDQQIDASIAHIPVRNKSVHDADPYATISVGAASSQGMRFRILRPHAEGGLGRVSVALDGELGREVALKEIKPERADDPDSRGRFTREAEITGGLEHPGIVPVYGLGAYPDGRPFYAMRFIRGKSLKEAIEKFHGARGGVGFQPAQKKLSPTEENLELRKLLQRLIDVCEAMDYAHSRGVLHRDLKPGNIMLGKYGETLVVDWGLAKPLGKPPSATPEQHQTDTTVGLSSLPEAPLELPTSGSDPTLLGSALGTPAFMSPEQALGRLDLLGPASDIFSMGAILYQILTGQPPYVAATKEDVLRKAQDADYPVPHILRRGIPAPLEAICLKALASAPAHRYSSCRALAADLERFLADEPVTARRETIVERLSRFSRRHRSWVQAAATALVLLTAGSILALAIVNDYRGKATATAVKNKALAEELDGKSKELKGKNDDLEAKNNEIQVRLATNFFEHGCAEYQLERPANAVAELRRALYAIPVDHESRSTFREVLIDRVMQGGRLQSPPLRHDGVVYDVSFSPDGTKLATASDDRTARIWNVATGEPVGKPLRHKAAVLLVAFSPDGAKLATYSGDGCARIWNLATDQVVGEPLQHPGGFHLMSFSPDATRLATGTREGTCRIWDAATGEPVVEPLQHDAMVTAAVFSPDGTRLATSSYDATARIWNTQTGAPVGEPLRHDNVIYDAAFSPDGTKVATASWDKTARIWNAQTGAPIGEPMRHDDNVARVAFSPDGTKLATASQDSSVRIWNVATCQELGPPLHGFGVVFSPDGTKVVTASGDKAIQIWYVATVQPEDARPIGSWNAATVRPEGKPLLHDAYGSCVKFSPDGTLVATSDANTARIWRVAAGQPAEATFRRDKTVQHSAFSLDGTRMATASNDKTARIWNLATGHPVGKPLEHDAPVVYVAFSPDGTMLATASSNKTVRIWNVSMGKPVGKALRHEAHVREMAFSPDGTKLATASEDGSALIWKVAQGQVMGHYIGAQHLAFSPDGSKLAIGSRDKTARIWNVATSEPVSEPLLHEGVVEHLAFSPDGTRLATASSDARIWNVTQGRPAGKPLRHDASILYVVFSPDGTRLATASNDTTARIWDVATGRPVGEPLRHNEPVWHVAFSPDGTRLATASRDGTARIWSAATAQPLGEPLRLGDSVWHVGFSLDGTRLVTASAADVRIWSVSATPTLVPHDLEPWLTAMTGQPMEENGDLKGLMQEQWLEARKKLAGIKEWHDYLTEQKSRLQQQHRTEAEQAEFDKDWFAAAFHLRWALKKEPGNEELKKRLAAAEQKLKEEQEVAKQAGPKVGE